MIDHNAHIFMSKVRKSECDGTNQGEGEFICLKSPDFIQGVVCDDKEEHDYREFEGDTEPHGCIR